MLSCSMTPEEFVKRLDSLKRLKRELPGVVGNHARSFFLENFRKGGFYDKAFVPWAKRKITHRYYRNTDRKGVAGEGKYNNLKLSKAGKGDAGRALLVKTGKLRRGIAVLAKGDGYVVIGNRVPYAGYHNDGVEGRLPKRQFIGESEKLSAEIKELIVNRALALLEGI